MTPVGIRATAGYLPERWMTAAEIAAASDIPEWVIVEKFGLRGKHIAASDEHVTDMSVAAAERLLADAEVDPAEVDAVVYYGSTWKDRAVWQAAPDIQHRLGCTNAFSLELEYVSCGTPVALRVCKDLLVAEPELTTVLAVAACKESQLIDYTNERARFTFNFADGAVAGLLVADQTTNEVLGSHMITDGRFSRDVYVPAGGSVEPASHETVDADRHMLDVPDPAGMKERLDPVTMDNFVRVAEVACQRSGIELADLDHLCGIHMKRSIHDALVDRLGVDPARAVYLDDTGHMSGVDPLLGLDRAARAGDLADGDHVLLLAAGTGYTWAATVVRWGGETS
ncbi:MAG: 3-oxoacyl-ACP synthase [Nitriliruptorales bacterium]|nr:3-oxoacyl-ACP synthase [Nitriliruptorales bacterium]